MFLDEFCQNIPKYNIARPIIEDSRWVKTLYKLDTILQGLVGDFQFYASLALTILFNYFFFITHR